ncbi:methyl-accepting chemotaxis protein [Sneathiella litorea]|uniref:HAMP domain-containing protein n=1 Tax=Sneathiella litorea TaxID=2606216 RepID=A0A6L8W9Y6_9PROT|nr:methyl-accepting chemotaxis protein [Sneathiella litorea]MZR31384.1 HAMP domain-containing protein [Sneathiella litorea]
MVKKINQFFTSKGNQEDTAEEVKYSKFGIGPRLVAAFSIVAILTIAISVISWISLGTITSAQQELNSQKVPAISLALKLANETTALAAAAPQLSTAKTEAERNQSFKAITNAGEKASARLNSLRKYMDGNLSLQKVDDGLNKMQDSLVRLNEQVQKRIEYSNQLSTTAPRLSGARDTLDTGLSAFLLPLRVQVIENSDNWSKMLSHSVDQALTGVKPDYDTSEYSKEILDILGFQDNIFTFKSNGYQMLSLLTEGLQADDIWAVKDLEAVFLSSIASIGTPLSEIENRTSKAKAQELSKLFNDFLAMGVEDSTENSINIFKTRIKELEAADAAQNIVSESRFLAGILVKNVNTFTSEIEASLGTAATENSTLANTTRMTLLLCAVVALIITIGIGWLYVRRNIIRRLMLLVDSAQRLSEGDLSSSIYREGRDEIARMGHALVGFRDTAREAEAARAEAEMQRQKRDEEKAKREEEQRNAEREATETKTRERNQLADTFEGSVKHLVENFAAAAVEMTEMSQSMTSSAEDTTQRSATVASASDLAASSVNSVAAATEELTSSINEISRQVNKAANIAGEAVSEAERTNIMVTSLNEAASKIGDVVGLINDIAGQTNLLALNATIEAARAGDAGKGFAVVASEVKNLAAQTAKATEEISEQIKAVQEETGNAVGAIGGITTTIGKINEIATSISAAVEEQGAATGEISRSVQQAAEGSQEVSQNILSVRNAAELTGKAALEVQEISNGIAKEVSELDQQVEGFLAQIRAS